MTRRTCTIKRYIVQTSTFPPTVWFVSFFGGSHVANRANMARDGRVRALVSQRLAVAVEEICQVLERTMAEYEQEVCRYRRLLHAVYKPDVRLRIQGSSPSLSCFSISVCLFIVVSRASASCTCSYGVHWLNEKLCNLHTKQSTQTETVLRNTSWFVICGANHCPK